MLQVVILAAGLGSRLQSFTRDRPKPLVEINGVPAVRCDCAHCAAAITDERSAILWTESGRLILLDAGVDIRQQLLTYQARNIDEVLVTHEHYDHAYRL